MRVDYSGSRMDLNALNRVGLECEFASSTPLLLELLQAALIQVLFKVVRLLEDLQRWRLTQLGKLRKEDESNKQSLTVPSELADASVLPSGLKATLKTES